METRTYVTRTPDRAGAFKAAAGIIAAQGGNLARVSYNKAVDAHTIFLDVTATEEAHKEIQRMLAQIGYLTDPGEQTRVLVVDLQIPDAPGELYPALEVLDRHQINISYLNYYSGGSPDRRFRMGLLVSQPDAVRHVLEELSALYPVSVVDYDDSETTLDNTVFYLRFGGEMARIAGLSREATLQFIAETDRILQVLDARGEKQRQVFEDVRSFARFVHSRKGAAFHAQLSCMRLSPQVRMTVIEPPCGSNTYILESPEGLTLIDSGFAVYAEEMLALLRQLFPQWQQQKKRLLITHADVDHCGLLSVLGEGKIWLNRKSGEALALQAAGLPDKREEKEQCMGYSRLSRIVSWYHPPAPERFHYFDEKDCGEHDQLLEIGSFQVGDMTFEVWEVSGGHLPGEMAFFCRDRGVAFTGDIVVNIAGFSPELREFSKLAPELMTSVNLDSRKAKAMRFGVLELLGQSPVQPVLLCGGHGPAAWCENGALRPLEKDEQGKGER